MVVPTATRMPLVKPLNAYARIAAHGYRERLATQDRKSTRLNSSHGYISYAVFCLKKKKHKRKLSTHTAPLLRRHLWCTARTTMSRTTHSRLQRLSTPLCQPSVRRQSE